MGMSVGALAEKTITSPTESDTTEVKYDKAETWTVKIPDEVTIPVGGTTTANISAENVDIITGNSLKVSVSSENYSSNHYQLINKAHEAIDYDIKVSSASIANEGIVLTVSDDANTGNAELSFEASEIELASPGSYTDTLTFKVVSEE